MFSYLILACFVVVYVSGCTKLENLAVYTSSLITGCCVVVVLLSMTADYHLNAREYPKTAAYAAMKAKFKVQDVAANPSQYRSIHIGAEFLVNDVDKSAATIAEAYATAKPLTRSDVEAQIAEVISQGQAEQKSLKTKYVENKAGYETLVRKEFLLKLLAMTGLISTTLPEWKSPPDMP